MVLGTGGHASVVIDAAKSAGYVLAGCVGPQRPAFGPDHCAYLGGDEELASLDPSTTAAAVGVGSIGDTGLRERLFHMASTAGFALPAIVHARASVARTADLGEGSQVMAGAVVQPYAALGRNAIVNSGAVIEHHVVVGDYAHVAPGAIVCGEVRVGARAHIGAGATVIQGIRLGEGVLVAAGAVVVRDVPPHTIARGVPAGQTGETSWNKKVEEKGI